LSLLFVATTIREQAGRIDSGCTEEEGVACVPLAPGRSGKTLVFVCFPGGSAKRFSPVAECLQDVRILALTSPLKPAGTGAEDPIHIIARQQTDALLQAAPDDDLVIAGFSTGGLIAVDIARRLRKVGRHVEAVVLLDTLTPSVLRQLRQRRFPGLVRDSVRAIGNHDWSGRKEFLLEYAVRFGLKARQVWVRKTRRNRMKAGPRSVQADTPARLGSSQKTVSVDDALYELAKHHQVSRYDGRVVLVRARDQTLFGLRDFTLGWSHLVPNTLEVRTMPGSHNSMLQDRHAPHLAGLLAELLGRTPPAGRGQTTKATCSPIRA
jgi:thioesterase domain-containing protein